MDHKLRCVEVLEDVAGDIMADHYKEVALVMDQPVVAIKPPPGSQWLHCEPGPLVCLRLTLQLNKPA